MMIIVTATFKRNDVSNACDEAIEVYTRWGGTYHEPRGDIFDVSLATGPYLYNIHARRRNGCAQTRSPKQSSFERIITRDDRA